MLYRKLGKTGWDVSALGFGCMRLPLIKDSNEEKPPIDEEASLEMIQYAIDRGVNYFDTAYPYLGGRSEPFTGRALKPYRDRIRLATKLPVWLVEKPADCDRILNEQLERLDTEFLDVYLLHSLNRSAWSKMKELDILGFMDRIRSDGRTVQMGFSFHADVEIFKEIVDAYDWDLCQIQYNFFDEHFQAGREGLDYAAAKGMGVVIMEPLRGGRLTDNVPPAVQKLWDSSPRQRTPAEWGLRWVWNHPQVSTVLSGMSTMAQVEENIRIAGEAVPGALTESDLNLIGRVAEEYRARIRVPCTACGYCLPCPNGVNIPLNFRLYNDVFMFDEAERSAKQYHHSISPEARASNCVECGQCVELCPQAIDIPEELKRVDEYFEG